MRGQASCPPVPRCTEALCGAGTAWLGLARPGRETGPAQSTPNRAEADCRSSPPHTEMKNLSGRGQRAAK